MGTEGLYRSRSCEQTAPPSQSGRRLLANLITETSQGKQGGSNATVRQLLDEWLRTSKGDVTGSTYATYERIANLLKTTQLGLVKLNHLVTHDIQSAYAELHAAKTTDHTMVQVHRYLGTALRKAMDWGWIRTNPQAVKSLRPHKPKVEPKSMTPANVLARVAEAAKTDPDLAAMILLAAKTGLRRGEAAALRFGDIDGNVLSVRRSHSIVKGKVVDGPPKMRHESDEPERIQLANISNDCIDAIKAICQRQFDTAVSLGTELPPNGFVLSSDGMGNTPRRPDRLGREIREATLRTYVHDDRSQDAAAADLLDESLRPKT